MDEPKKPEDPKKNPRNHKAPIRDREPRSDEKNHAFRGSKRVRVRGRTNGNPAN